MPTNSVERLEYDTPEAVPATQVVHEVDWSNMNAAMMGLGFDLMSIKEFCRLNKADVVRGYYEGKLLLFRQMR